MALLAVFIPLLMLGVVLALGRCEELLLQTKTKNADGIEEARTGPLAATLPIRVLPTQGPVGTRASASGASGTRPSESAGTWTP